VVAIVLLAADHFRARLRVAELPLDNLVHAAFQADRAVLRLRLAAIEAEAGRAEAEDALQWLEILLGRIDLLGRGRFGLLLMARADAAAALGTMQGMLADLDHGIGTAPDDAARLAILRATAEPLGQASARLAVESTHVTSAFRTAWAAEHGGAERQLGLLVGAAVAAALGLFGLLWLQSRRLAREREAAEAASRAKTDFLANMSHELRTPLNGVLGMLDLLSDETLPPAARERAATAQASARQLMAVIGDILDMSKLEAGRVELECVPFALGPLLRRAVATFAAAATAKGVRLELAMEPAAEGWFLGDPTRLTQIVPNLVANAVKFTGQGSVAVAATAAPAPDGTVLTIEVRDSGIGIERATLRTLFDKFTQADSSTTRRYGGTGLGLAICRELAQIMGGTIEAESEVGHGAVFRLRLVLPATTPPEIERTPLPRASTPAAPRVLLVEDDRVNRLVADSMLRKLGAEVAFAASGEDALRQAAARPFDLILMDIQMPGMDGLAVTRAIRAGSGPNAGARIVALSANAFSDDVARSLEAGMDDHAPKPVSRATLARLLAGERIARREDA
jgi:signal transduction histidine kinase/ActR/RegA family two-component response regulator